MTTHQQKIFDQLVKCAKETYGVDPLIDSRKTMYVWARMAITLEMVKLGVTYENIGKAFNRDHSSICHYSKRHSDLMIDAKYRELYGKFKMESFAITGAEKLRAEELIENAKHISSQLYELGYSKEFLQELWSQKTAS